jgi:hypothetical protein
LLEVNWHEGKRNEERKMIALLLLALQTATPPATAVPQHAPNAEACASTEKKIAAIQANSTKPPDQRGGPVTLTEAEIESFFALSKVPKIPEGVSGIRFEIHPGKQHGTAIVDFDKYNAASKRPMNPLVELFLRGKRTINIEGKAFPPSDGMGHYHLDFASLDDFTVQGSTIQFILKWFVLTRYPKAEMDKPFVLPANIRKVEVQEGRIVIYP